MATFERPCLVDIGTQFDFVRPQGALYVRGAWELIPIWKQLTDLGQSLRLTMIATVDSHILDDPEFADCPPHCVVGTVGQSKIPETLAAYHQFIRRDHYSTIDFDAQVILEKVTVDIFAEPYAETVFGAVQCSTFVVYGVTTERSVRAAVLGLLMRGLPVHVISDAVRTAVPAAGERALAEMASAGADFVQSAAFIENVRQQVAPRTR